MSQQKLHFLAFDMLFYISTKFGGVTMLLTLLNEALFVLLFMFATHKILGDDGAKKWHIFLLQLPFFVVIFANSVYLLPKVHTDAFVQTGDFFPLRYSRKSSRKQGMVTHLGDDE